jgi:hypothetical protein
MHLEKKKIRVKWERKIKWQKKKRTGYISPENVLFDVDERRLLLSVSFATTALNHRQYK